MLRIVIDSLSLWSFNFSEEISISTGFRMSYFYSSFNLIYLFNRGRENHFAIFDAEDKSISFKTKQTWNSASVLHSVLTNRWIDQIDESSYVQR